MRIAVVGAGFAGLACAVDLARAGIDVTVYEARDRVGGRVWSDVMPDGSPFERGGEFVESGYDHMLRRAAEYGLALAPQGFEFAAREVRMDGRSDAALLLAAGAAVAAALQSLGDDAAGVSAAHAIAHAHLDATARTALTRRLEGTYTVELERVSAAWLSSAELRAGGDAVELPSSRLALGNDALARAMARALGERLRLSCPVRGLRVGGPGAVVLAGEEHRYDRVVLTLPLPILLTLAPALRDRRAYARLVFGTAAKLHVPLASPAAPAAVQGLDAAYWTWTARAADGGPGTFASSFAGGARAIEALAVGDGPDRWRDAVQALRPELELSAASVLTDWGAEPFSGGSYSCHPPGWSAADDRELAAPLGPLHLAGEHTAAEFCGTMEGALRSGARAAGEVLAAQ